MRASELLRGGRVRPASESRRTSWCSRAECVPSKSSAYLHGHTPRMLQRPYKGSAVLTPPITLSDDYCIQVYMHTTAG